MHKLIDCTSHMLGDQVGSDDDEPYMTFSFGNSCTIVIKVSIHAHMYTVVITSSDPTRVYNSDHNM